MAKTEGDIQVPPSAIIARKDYIANNLLKFCLECVLGHC